MNLDYLSNNVDLFCKLAYRLDPFRNAEHDIEEALDYAAQQGVGFDDYQDFNDIPRVWLNIEQIEHFPLRDLLQFDKYKIWGDVDFGELKRKSRQERALFLRRLRGKYAERWLEEGIPAIVILDLPGFKAIGDGRGRTQLAVGMGYQTVPVIIITAKDEFVDRIKYYF